MEYGLDKENSERTLELASRIRKRPVCMLIDLGVTGNNISAQECAERRIKIER